MPDHETDHTTDEAELEERDRPQPNLVTREANRPDDDGVPDREERQTLLDEVADDG